MSIASLWSSLVVLPAEHVSPKASLSEPSSWDLNVHLPSWERHPRQKAGQATGGLDPEWIRRHLP